MADRAKTLRLYGFSLVSALGPDIATSCAAARAGLSRLQPLEDFPVTDPATGEPEIAGGHYVFGIAGGAQGLGRLARLGIAGLRDLVATIDVPMLGRTGLFVNVTNGYYYEQWERISGGDNDDYAEYFREKLAERLLPLILEQVEPEIQFAEFGLHLGGDCGIVDLFSRAQQEIAQGRLDSVIVGGIDSLVDPHLLVALGALGVIKTPSRPDGFHPGELSAFVCFTKDRMGAGDSRFAGEVHAWSSSHEAAHRFAEGTPRGEVLSKVIGSSLASLDDSALLRALVCTMSGDYYRANDWGHTLHRLGDDSRIGSADITYSAVAFGDTGAASGLGALARACWESFRLGATGDTTLACLLGDDGSRASFAFTRD